MQPSSFSSINKPASAEKISAPWVLTLADLLSLMLTFFVMLYAMQRPMSDEWKQLQSSFKQEFSNADHENQPAISGQNRWLQKIPHRYHELSYHYHILEQLLQSLPTPRPEIAIDTNQITISLQGDVFFAPASADLNPARFDDLQMILSAIERTNLAITLIGHSDPAPMHSEQFPSNWVLSLARAQTVAAVAEHRGIMHIHKILGASSGEYHKIMQDLPQAKRYAKARRVDIVLRVFGQ